MPLPLYYARARHIVRDYDQREHEIVTWWVSRDVPTPPRDLAYARAFATAIDNAINTAWLPVLPATCDWLGTSCTMHFNGVIYSSVALGNAMGFGLAASDGEPSYVAAVIRKFSGAPGRSGYGRWFIPCVAETHTLGNQLHAPGYALFVTLGNVLAADIVVMGDTWHAGHRSVKGNTLIPIIATSVDNYLKRLGRRELRSLL